MRISFVLPDRNVFNVDRKPSVYLPDLMTSARRAFTFSAVFFFDLTILNNGENHRAQPLDCCYSWDAKESARILTIQICMNTTVLRSTAGSPKYTLHKALNFLFLLQTVFEYTKYFIFYFKKIAFGSIIKSIMYETKRSYDTILDCCFTRSSRQTYL